VTYHTVLYDVACGVATVTLNRPEKLNALNDTLADEIQEAVRSADADDSVRVIVLIGAGKGFCSGLDLTGPRNTGNETTRKQRLDDFGWVGRAPLLLTTIDKPVIVAVNGYAMGGGFQLVERADLRVAVRGAVLEMSEAKRWLLGGYQHGFMGGLPHAVATEMAFAYRFTAERLHELGYINRLVDEGDLLSVAQELAAHLITLPPASRVNTLMMMRAMRPVVSPELQRLAAQLHEHGAKEDLMESRRAFAEKRKPNFKGWDQPADRSRTPTLESVRREASSRPINAAAAEYVK